jgi:hypothetical protein
LSFGVRYGRNSRRKAKCFVRTSTAGSTMMETDRRHSNDTTAHKRKILDRHYGRLANVATGARLDRNHPLVYSWTEDFDDESAVVANVRVRTTVR